MDGLRLLRRGDIVKCDLGSPEGHEPGGHRPVLIVSPDDVNRYGLPIVVPLTRTHKPWPMRVEIEGPLPEVCYAQCEQVRAVAASRMGRLYGQVDPVQMAQVEQVLRRLLGL